MTIVSLHGMQFYAFHGYYDFERRVGTNFVLDIDVKVDLTNDPKDKIEHTVNYETIFEVSERFMNKKYKLLESLVYDLGTALKKSDKDIVEVRVKLSKLNPPLPGKVDRAAVEMTIQ